MSAPQKEVSNDLEGESFPSWDLGSDIEIFLSDPVVKEHLAEGERICSRFAHDTGGFPETETFTALKRRYTARQRQHPEHPKFYKVEAHLISRWRGQEGYWMNREGCD